MRKEANNHQTQMENVVKNRGKPEGLVEETTQETEQKATKIIETYL